MHHARMVRRLFSYIGEGGHIPHEWFAAEVARLDNVNGDIEALADRLAGIRSWAYIAQRADWLADPVKWAERTAQVEGRLTDALARTADPALRRSPHRRAGPRHRRARRRCACRHRRRRRRGQRRPRADRTSCRVRVHGRSRLPAMPTSACCSPPPSAAWATSSTAAQRRCSTHRTALSRSWSRTMADWRSAGRATSSPASRQAARCSNPRSAPRAPLDRLSAQRRASFAPGSNAGSTAELDAPRPPARHLAAAASTPRSRRRARARRDARRCRRASSRAARSPRRSPRSTRPTAIRCTASGSGSARSTCSCRPAQARRPTLARRPARDPRGPADAAPTRSAARDARRQRRSARGRACLSPLRRRWLRIDLADRLAAHAHAARQAGSDACSTMPLVTSLGLDPDASAKADGGSRLRPDGRCVEMARPSPTAAAGRAAPRPGNAFAALAELKRSTAFA